MVIFISSKRYIRNTEKWGHSNLVLTVMVTPDGSRVLSGSTDNTMKVWDIDTGECLITIAGHSSSVLATAITSDGSRVVSGSSDNTVKVWDLETGECLETLEGHLNMVKAVAVTPDGSRVVSGSSDHTVKVWDLEKTIPIIEFKHDFPVLTVCIV